MANITAYSKPQDSWTPAELVEWHKKLVELYKQGTVLVTAKDGKKYALNPMASEIFNKEWDKLSNFSGVKLKITNPLSNEYKKEKDYIRSWIDLKPAQILGVLAYDPSIVGIQILKETGETIVETGKGIIKGITIVAVGITIVILAVSTAYVYNSFKKSK